MTKREGFVFGAILAVALGALLAWIGTSRSEEMRESLPWIAPRMLQLTLVLLAAGAAASFSELRSSLPGRSLLHPVAVGLLAILAVRMLPPRTHRIYYDEDIYQNVAQNILWEGRAQMCNEGTIEAGTFRCHAAEYNKEPSGFPFLLSHAFRITGVRESTAHLANHVIFGLGAVAAFWIASMLFGSGLAGVGAALVWILSPQHLLWGATVAAEPGAAAFGALGVGASILFCRAPSWRTGLFAASALAFGSQFRPESGLILAVAGAFVLLLSPGLLRTRELAGAAILLLILLLPQLAHTWTVRNEPWGGGQSGKFSREVVPENARTNLGYLVGGRDFPPLFTALAVLGLVLPRTRREASGLLLWFLLSFGIFIPFYAGSYRYGADVRFALVSGIPLAIAAGGGLGWLEARLRRLRPASRAVGLVPSLVVLYAFSAYLPLIRAVGPESWASRADHAAALRMVSELPEDSILLTHNPGMIQVMGRSAAQTSLATYQPARVDELFRRFAGGVYFHYNFWCNVRDPIQNEFCTNVLAGYGTRVLHEESAGFYRYVLYRLLPRSEPPPPLAAPASGQ